MEFFQEIEFILLPLAIVIAGYLIGDGLKNFQNSDSIFDALEDDDDDHELIKESDVHYFIGISKEDAKSLIKEYPNIPHTTINGNVYYPKGKLREWLREDYMFKKEEK
ncbi:hypothetical protein RH915_07825 [Serpentinicella sp. ANB-PHB4]|uniref:hypothetical protein n=1 Tax=Serpentinicella sp. ANB-PHB4 TaxID=3074076 RepID=UPI00285C2692|nr:hypothetical protein [Serpentinicella sp. ANB-PHB4]MDR5659396.1 hypothetical protein [Serpentinicella sp. ANB-PHB4]